ncbi:MAG: hypothetical protein ACOC5E_00640 [Acidobacteriota bacterium]
MTPDRETTPPRPHPPLPGATGIRWLGAIIAILYGFAKINDAQFTVLDSRLDQPLRDLSGFWLAWHFFGYSAVYGNLIALLQVIGGLLLAVPRTAVLGAVMLLPMAVNILLVDLFYGIDLGGTLAGVVFLACLVVVLIPHAGRLWRAFLPAQRRSGRRDDIASAVAALLVVALTCGFTWWVANYNNRAPTPIDGVWDVVEAPATGDLARVDRVYFERNRAFLVVFRTEEGELRSHHFELEPSGHLRIWHRWLDADESIYEGRVIDEDSIRLHPVGEATAAALLRRRFDPGFE